jgi:hypothetical protein
VRQQSLNKLNSLCPGDFGAVFRRVEWEDKMDFSVLIKELESDLKYKQQGFTKPGFELA